MFGEDKERENKEKREQKDSYISRGTKRLTMSGEDGEAKTWGFENWT